MPTNLQFCYAAALNTQQQLLKGARRWCLQVCARSSMWCHTCGLSARLDSFNASSPRTSLALACSSRSSQPCSFVAIGVSSDGFVCPTGPTLELAVPVEARRVEVEVASFSSTAASPFLALAFCTVACMALSAVVVDAAGFSSVATPQVVQPAALDELPSLRWVAVVLTAEPAATASLVEPFALPALGCPRRHGRHWRPQQWHR